MTSLQMVQRYDRSPLFNVWETFEHAQHTLLIGKPSTFANILIMSMKCLLISKVLLVLEKNDNTPNLNNYC